jgi:hypothetical protein
VGPLTVWAGKHVGGQRSWHHERARLNTSDLVSSMESMHLSYFFLFLRLRIRMLRSMGPNAAACRAARILALTTRRHAAASVTGISLRASIAHKQLVRALTRAPHCTALGRGLRASRPR